MAQRRGRHSYKVKIGGSSPPGTTCCCEYAVFIVQTDFVLTEQFGVLATLSRWRSRVQVPLGTLIVFITLRVMIRHAERDEYDGAVRKPGKRRSSELRDRLWVRLPPVLLIWFQIVSVGHWQASVPVKHLPSGTAGSTPARRTRRIGFQPVRQKNKDNYGQAGSLSYGPFV